MPDPDELEPVLEDQEAPIEIEAPQPTAIPEEIAPAAAQAAPMAGSIIINCIEESRAYTGDHPLAGLYLRGDVFDIPGDVSSEVAAGLIAAGIAEHVI